MTTEWTDKHGQMVCGICIDGVAPIPYECHLDDKSRRVYTWDVDLEPQVLEKLDAYLANPKCSAETHKWHEDKQLTEALQELRLAAIVYARFQNMKPGWSCNPKKMVTKEKHGKS